MAEEKTRRATRIFMDLNKEQLRKIATKEDIGFDKDTTKKAMSDLLSRRAETLGVRMLLENMSKKELEAAFEVYELKKGEGVNHPTKIAMSKRLMEKAEEEGGENFFGSFTDDLLQAVADKLDLELEDLSDKAAKKSAVKKIFDQVLLEGTEALLHRFDSAFLKACAKEAGIRGTSSAPTKSILVSALVTKKNIKDLKSTSSGPHHQEQFNKDAEKALKRKKAPEIEKGVSYQDLFQWYKSTDLSDWCRDHELKINGKKDELCKRILAFLDGDTETTKPSAPGERSKRGRSRSRSKSPAPSKKAKAKTSPKKKSTKDSKKEKKEEKEVESEEEKEEKKEDKKSSKDSKKGKKEKEEKDESEDEKEEKPASPKKSSKNSKKDSPRKGKKDESDEE